MATETLKKILKIGDSTIWSHALAFDLLQATPRRHGRSKHPDCPCCAQQPTPCLALTCTPENTPAATRLADETIDITRERCPMTFVKVKLKLETMSPGQRLVVRLTGEEPRHNVPRTLHEQGFPCTTPTAEPDGTTYTLVVTKPLPPE
ncbi:MAG: hypothetical protein G8237_04750 [Magnetococcales bacterium]|nr:hypothetical protein [Magnetococcales bacterium]